MYLRIYQEHQSFNASSEQYWRFEIDWEVADINAEEYFLFNNRELWQDFKDVTQINQPIVPQSEGTVNTVNVFTNQGTAFVEQYTSDTPSERSHVG